MQLFRQFLARLWKDRAGNFAIIFVFALIPLLLAAGAAIDISRAYIVEARLKAALDAAALAVGTASGKTEAEVQALAQAYFDANYPAEKLGVPGKLVVNDQRTTVDLSVDAVVPTALMGLINIDKINVSAVSQVMRHGKKLEVVLVLDNTGSMDHTRMSVLKTAAKDLIDTVTSAALIADDVRISVVPFTTDVNIGTAAKNEPWMKWSWVEPEYCRYVGSGRNRQWICSKETRSVNKNSWAGCVTDRDQSYDVTSEGYTPNRPATQQPANTSNEYNGNCSLQPIMPLTTNVTGLKSTIENMKAGGATNTTIGFAWGWQMLIHGGFLSTASAKNPKELDKVMVYLTDGMNTYYREGIYNCTGHSACSGADARTELVCQNIKHDGIQVYTIRLIDGNEALLKNCATRPDMYYSVSKASDLTNVFRSIAQALSNLRLSK